MAYKHYFTFNLILLNLSSIAIDKSKSQVEHRACVRVWTFLWDPAGPGSSVPALSLPPSCFSPGRVWPWCSCPPQSSADGPAPPGLWWWRPTKVESTQSVKLSQSIEGVIEVLNLGRLKDELWFTYSYVWLAGFKES